MGWKENFNLLEMSTVRMMRRASFRITQFFTENHSPDWSHNLPPSKVSAVIKISRCHFPLPFIHFSALLQTIHPGGSTWSHLAPATGEREHKRFGDDGFSAQDCLWTSSLGFCFATVHGLLAECLWILCNISRGTHVLHGLEVKLKNSTVGPAAHMDQEQQSLKPPRIPP